MLGFWPSSSLEIQSLSPQHRLSAMGSRCIRFLVERRLLGEACNQEQPQQVSGVNSWDRGGSRGWLRIGEDTVDSWSLECSPAMVDSQCSSICLGVRGKDFKSLHLTLHSDSEGVLREFSRISSQSAARRRPSRQPSPGVQQIG